MTGPRAHQESFAKRPGKPMGLTASGQLIDRYSAVFLPSASSGDRRCTGGISRQHLANLAAAADQAIEVRQVSLDLRAQAFIHRLHLTAVCPHPRGVRGCYEPRRRSDSRTRIRELLTVRWKHANFSSRKWFDDRTSI